MTKQVRIARLKEWFAGKTLPAKEKSYLSQLMSGASSFGEKAARRIEITYEMPSGFLDSAGVATNSISEPPPETAIHSRPRTIQIFLPSGDPSGIRQAEITMSIIRVIEVPRRLLSSFLAMPEALQVGIYCLIGGDEANALYIGQAGAVGKRLSQHHKDDSKDWSRALVLVSMTNNITQTHVLYLEFMAIEKAKVSARYVLSNSNGGTRPHTPPPLQAECDEIFDVFSLLVTTLGFPLFVPLVITDKPASEKFFCVRGGVLAEGYYTAEGFIVLKGSRGRLISNGKPPQRLIQLRQEQIEAGVFVAEGDAVVLVKDTLFKTPSAASGALLIAASNGWVDWKNKQGISLSDIYRNA